MFTLIFSHSRSSRFKEVLRYALFFKGFRQEKECNILELPIRDIIEKWEWFNQLFWIVVDWKGTTVSYEGVTYHSHQDKTRLFYAIQQIHTNWMNYTADKLIASYKVVPDKSKLLDIDVDKLSNEEINQLIDVMLVKINVRKQYEEEMEGIGRRILNGK